MLGSYQSAGCCYSMSLIPLTRDTFETLIPSVATGAQYAYYWGRLPDLLRRVLISVVGVFAVLIFRVIVGDGFEIFELLAGITVGFYWLWGPVLWASLKNREYRRYAYTGFWQGQVLDVYVTNEVISKEETVNKIGDLVIVENRERCLNLEIGDETGYSTLLKVPLKRNHQSILWGDMAQMLVLSDRRDLGRITKTTDVYIPNNNVWVSDYPFLQREAFIEVGRGLQAELRTQADELRRPRQGRRPRTNEANDYGDDRDYSRDNDYEPTSRRVPRSKRTPRYLEETSRRSRQGNPAPQDNGWGEEDSLPQQPSDPNATPPRRRRRPRVDWG